MTKTRSYGLLLALLGGLAVPFAAGPATAQTASPTGTQATAFASQTTDQDKADFAYVAKLPRRGTSVELDFSDPIQHRFFLRNWQLAGITAERFPRLSSTVEELRQAHADRLARQSRTQPLNLTQDTSPASTTSAQIVPVNVVSRFGPTAVDSQFTATAYTTVPGTLQTDGTVTATTIGLYDRTGQQYGPVTPAVQFGNGAQMENTTLALVTDGQPVRAIGTYLYRIQDSTGALVTHAGALFAETTAVAGASQSARTAVGATSGTYTMVNSNPVDSTKDGVIKVCINRQGILADCDYYSSSPNGVVVEFPITDAFTIPDTPQSVSNQRTSGYVSITITDPNAGDGGGCTLPAAFDFWSYVTISGNTLSWNIDPGPFSNPDGSSQPCFPNNSNVVYDLIVDVLGTDSSGNTSYWYGEVKTTTNPPPTPPPGSVYLVPMVVAWGCVAEGTEVTLEDGRQMAIEAIAVGDRVRTAPNGPVMVVTDKTRGMESAPMIRLAAGGRSVLLTETHPVITPDGAVMARDLRPGVTILTADGPLPVRSVERERFDGRVWNLELASAEAVAATPRTGSTFLAGGVVVGDNRMQKGVEDRERQRIARAAERPPAAEWRVDAANYARLFGKSAGQTLAATP